VQLHKRLSVHLSAPSPAKLDSYEINPGCLSQVYKCVPFHDVRERAGHTDFVNFTQISIQLAGGLPTVRPFYSGKGVSQKKKEYIK
jgi:hypothetical protein